MSYIYTNFNQFSERLSDVNYKKGKMHDILNIPDDKKITDVYTSGKELAKDLVDKVGKKEATGMLAFAANINKEHDIFDIALSAMKNL